MSKYWKDTLSAGLLLLASMGFAQDAKSQIVQSSKDSIFAVIKKATSHHTNQNFVTNNYQKQMLQRWFSYHTDIQVSRVSPKDRKHTAPFIHEANKLYIVDDITIGQIPMLIQHMTSMTYGSQAPNEAVSHSIQKNLYTYIQILKSYKTESDADSLVGQYTSLYMQLYPTANDPLLGEDSTLIDDNLYTQYVANHLDDIDMPRVVDSLLTNDIVGGLYTSVFEHGAQKIRTVSNLDQTIHIKSYQDQLTKTTATGNKLTLAAQQKKIIKEIMLLINQSDLSKQSYGRSFLDESVPTKIMQTKKIACVGLSTLMHSLLEDLDIAHKGLILQNHVALQITLADGSSWYCDLTKPAGKDLIPYHTITLQDGGQSVVIATDTVHVIADDAEQVLISDILYNDQYGMAQINDKNIVLSKLTILHQAMTIDDQNHMVIRDIAKLYYLLGDYNNATTYIKKALILHPNNKLYLSTYRDILIKSGDFGPEFISVSQKLK